MHLENGCIDFSDLLQDVYKRQIESFRSYDTDFEKYTLGAYENWPEEKWIDVSAPEWQALSLIHI